jgi:hypothetical protein
MGIWHDDYEAKEVYGSRTEVWNDKSPQTTVDLHVEQDVVYDFINAIVKDRTEWPWSPVFSVRSSHHAPYRLYVSECALQPHRAHYTTDSELVTDEALKPSEGASLRTVRVTYRPNSSFLHTLKTTEGAGTASDYGYEEQEVWMDEVTQVETEHLTADFRDYVWYNPQTEKYDEINRDQAPVKVFRSMKVIRTFYNVFITQDIAEVLYNYSGTVNSDRIRWVTLFLDFEPEQILFQVEDIKPALQEFSTPLNRNLHDLKVSFHLRMGESTWNKYWRSTADATVEQSGWYDMYYRPRAEGAGPPVKQGPFEATDLWYIFLVPGYTP